MKKVPLLITTFLLVVTAARVLSTESSAQKKNYEPLIGTWDLSVLIEEEEQLSIFTFEMKKDTLKGVWNGDYGAIPLKNITFARDTLKCNLSFFTGTEFLILHITGTVKNNMMKGSAISDFGDYYQFTATKRKAKKSSLDS